MPVILQEHIYALYGQVALFDAQTSDAYPQWRTGIEAAAIGPYGIAVATAGDVDVEVIVYDLQDEDAGSAREIGSSRISGIIEVGNQGLLVGNVPASDLFEIEWPEGRTSVEAQIEGPPGQAIRVLFFLSHLQTE
jgi:hypothetical protein